MKPAPAARPRHVALGGTQLNRIKCFNSPESFCFITHVIGAYSVGYRPLELRIISSHIRIISSNNCRKRCITICSFVLMFLECNSVYQLNRIVHIENFSHLYTLAIVAASQWINSIHIKLVHYNSTAQYCYSYILIVII